MKKFHAGNLNKEFIIKTDQFINKQKELLEKSIIFHDNQQGSQQARISKKNFYQNKKQKEALYMLNYLYTKDCQIVLDQNLYTEKCTCKSYRHEKKCIKKYELCRVFLRDEYIRLKTHCFQEIPKFCIHLVSNKENSQLTQRFDTKRMQQQIIKGKYFTNNHFFDDRNVQ